MWRQKCQWCEGVGKSRHSLSGIGGHGTQHACEREDGVEGKDSKDTRYDCRWNGHLLIGRSVINQD